MALHQITDEIWLGSLVALSAIKTLKNNNVTHVLSVLDIASVGQNSERFKTEVTANFKHLYIDVHDDDSEDLMQYWPRTNEFIAEAISANGGVFVHCIAGISRSVSCVCAYLMKQNKWTPNEAISYVASKRKIANPNESFREQLECYYQCGYEVSLALKPYREWRLRHQSRTFDYQGVSPESVNYSLVDAPPPRLSWTKILRLVAPSHEAGERASFVFVNGSKHSLSEPVDSSVVDPRNDCIELVVDGERVLVSNERLVEVFGGLKVANTELRCKSCAQVLAGSASFLGHGPVNAHSVCQHYFVEPIEWMRPELERGELKGRLDCPKCGHKLGSYNWSGEKCTCGKYEVPAFKIQRSRVDPMEKRELAFRSKV